MMSTGKKKYVPTSILKGLENIKSNYPNIDSDARAFDKMAEFVPVGIEIEKAMTGTGLIYFFGRKRKK